MFTYGHRLRTLWIEPTTKSGGSVKKDSPSATSWGRGEAYRTVEKTICKVVYQFGRALHNNDNPTFAHIASDYDDQACAGDAESANRFL